MPNTTAAAMDESLDPVDLAANRRNLFLIGFLVLFTELACIRWFAAYVIFLQFFTNLILIACFVGMSIGCVCAFQKANWLKRFSWLSLGTMGLAIGFNLLYHRWEGLTIDVGGQGESPQMVFFGTEYRNVDLAQFVVPVELVAGIFFVLVTLMFVGLGQELGRAFDKDPNRVTAYTSNISGSLFGILGFALVSFAQAPPIIWFLICFAGVGYLLKQTGHLKRLQIILLALTALLTMAADISLQGQHRFFWSPYYRIKYNKESRGIEVNNIGHQRMLSVDGGGAAGGAVYSLIHFLQRDAGGPPFEKALIIGAGSGNDVAHSLRNGVQHIDAVEIDPVIQRLGVQYHPDRPYDDPRVHMHLDDGRNVLRRTHHKYDIVIYGLVDSLILHSSYSNIRLESFLLTEQAFRDVKDVLNPSGIFVSYNYFRQGWIVHRLAYMLEKVFQQKPLIISLPYVDKIRTDDERLLKRFTMIIAGNTTPIAEAFAKHKTFWFNRYISANQNASAFGPRPPKNPNLDKSQWFMIAPSVLAASGKPPIVSTDDWPFMYLRSPMIPWLYLRGVILLTALGLAILFWLAPMNKPAFNGRMFFLGAAFLLFETTAVVRLALLFGSTWVVNSLVFAAILTMILGANLYVLRAKQINLARHYAALLITLGIISVIPLDTFLAGNILWKYVAPCVLVMTPMFFAGVIFAVSFRASTNPSVDFGINIAGAVVGGFTEYLSMLLGFRYLLFVAIAFYTLSAIARRGESA